LIKLQVQDGMVERAGTNPIPPELLAKMRQKVELAPIAPAPLADRVEYLPILPIQDQNAVSATASQAKTQPSPPMDKAVQFRENKMLVIASASDPRYGSKPTPSAIEDQEVFGYRDMLVVPGVDADALQQGLEKLLSRPDAGAVVARIMEKLKQTCQEAEGQGYMVCPDRLEGEDFAWLFKAVDPKVAATYDYLKAVEAMLQPADTIINHPEDIQGRQKAIIRLHKDDPFKCLPAMGDHLRQGDLDLLELQLMMETGGDTRESLSSISQMMLKDVNALGGLVRDADAKRLVDPAVAALDQARGRLVAAADKHPADFAKFKALYAEKIVISAGALNAEDLALLARLGFEYDPTSKTLSTCDAKGQKQVLSPGARSILSQDIDALAETDASPAVIAYRAKVRDVMTKTGILQQATAELEQLMAHSRQLRQQQQQTDQELAAVDALKQRLANGGGLQSGDAALLHQIDPDLSLQAGADGKLHAFRDGQQVPDEDLQGLLDGRRQQLQTKHDHQETEIEDLDTRIRDQQAKVSTAKSDLEHSKAEAEQAFGELSPDEQRKFAGLHDALMRQADAAIKGATLALLALDDFAAAFGLGGFMSQAPSVETGSAGETQTEVGPLAPQPQGVPQDPAQRLADAKEKEAEHRHELSQQRQQQLNGEIQGRAMTAFLDRIQHLRSELVEESNEQALEQQDARSQELDGLA
ncbi:MAG: hypothetical protein ACAI44_26785, partial [Candidatus Sericytochromatia bacterium]